MGVFLRKIGLFMLIVAVGLTLVIATLLVFTDTNRDFQLPADITAVYIGDSRMELAINDALLDHSKNCGAQSESFFYSYFKLKKLLENNSGIQQVYLSIGHHSLSSYYDRFVDGNFSSSVAPNYIGILPRKEQTRIITANTETALKFSRNFVLQGLKKLFRSDGNLSTGSFNNPFHESKAANTSMDKRFQFQFYTNKKLNPLSEENRTYLKRIIALCAEHDVELVAISLPVHAYYFEHIPITYQEAFCAIIAEEQLRLIDLTQLMLTDDCYAPDGDHLSAKGADITSRQLKDRILSEIPVGCNEACN